MVILMIIYNKGGPRTDGKNTSSELRWITEETLYSLLSETDVSLPSEPPTGRGANVRSNSTLPFPVDHCLSDFVKEEYLIRERIKKEDIPEGTNGVLYTMGPRSQLEIGRLQIVHFTADVLGQKPDPNMINEIEVGEEGEDQEEEEEEDE